MKIWSIALTFLLFAKSVVASSENQEDPYLWLEEVDAPEVLEWVEERNRVTLGDLKKNPNFSKRESDALEIFNSDDRILYGAIRGEWVYNFWRNVDRPQGVWRRTSLENYLSSNFNWEELLDLDKLTEEEGIKWVWKGSIPLQNSQRVLIRISDGGKDAAEYREFDLESKSFLKDGFFLPEAKSRVAWIDENTLLIGTDFGGGSLTESGYNRELRIWTRDQQLAKSKSVLEIEPEHVVAAPEVLRDGDEKAVVLYDVVSFFDTEKKLLTDDHETIELPIPTDAEIHTLFRGQLVFRVNKPWTHGDTDYPADSLLALNLKAFVESREISSVQTIYIPEEGVSIQAVSKTENYLLMNTNENVVSYLYRIGFNQSDWEIEPLEFPPNGSISIINADKESANALVSFEDLISPNQLIHLNANTKEREVIQQLPARFDKSDLVVEQFFATSKDETKIPYFVVHSKSMTLDGSNPTYLYGYGGFQVSLNPTYLSSRGKLWLEYGGVYVLANIRGGGEFGPQWHQAALKENRQRAFDDFHAVAEDLIARGITSPEHLGIGGGSNGGLLVGVAFTQRPDLYNAVICNVPLLDMLRYHELPPGASWISEYGDPRIPEEREYIAKYSPYQNLDPDADYPKVFVYTSTRDDRVHPGHARKMVARMEEMEHPVYYFERIDGGHAGGANLAQYAELYALQFSYLENLLSGGKVD